MELMQTSDVAFKSLSSVLMNYTEILFRKLLQSLPKIEFVIHLKNSGSSFDVASCRFWYVILHN